MCFAINKVDVPSPVFKHYIVTILKKGTDYQSLVGLALQVGATNLRPVAFDLSVTVSKLALGGWWCGDPCFLNLS